jgi:hypothetical protein
VIEAVTMIARAIAASSMPRMKKNVISPMMVISWIQIPDSKNIIAGVPLSPL